MTGGVELLNSLPREDARAAFLSCCGSTRWATEMTDARPFADERELAETADRVWLGLGRDDWLAAFRSHPKIGERKAVREAGGEAGRWSEEEQKGTRDADAETTEKLARLNRVYEEKFGHIFIVCASGKSASEMLSLLEARLSNDADEELSIAAEEQRRITRLRLKKLLRGCVREKMSAITTHVLDTSRGRPAAGVRVRLELRAADGDWQTLGEGQTDEDGRLRTLLRDGTKPEPGVYRITFDTGAYFSASGVESFYPEASIHFSVRDASEHYHVPLLVSPFGYSTYRGS